MPDAGPPFPAPTIDAIRRMPEHKDMPELLEAKKRAARVWLGQFCARMRFVLKVANLTNAVRQDAGCAHQIDMARPLLTEDELKAALAGP